MSEARTPSDEQGQPMPAARDAQWAEKLHAACLEALARMSPDDPLRQPLADFCAELAARLPDNRASA